MSDESKAKAVSEHAVVKQEHTTLADEILFKSGCVSSGSRNPEKLAQLLADHDAEVERKAEREALIWATGAMSLNERDNAIIQRRIDELEQP